MTKEKNSSRKNRSGIVEDIRYYGAMPDEVLGEMTPEIIEQYYLWDEVIKKEGKRQYIEFYLCRYSSADRGSGYLPYGMLDE